MRRSDGTVDESKRGRVYRRLRLRRADGAVYLDRWGLAHDRIGGVMLHRMDAPDPGVDLHDHPWPFVTVPLWGGYTEQRIRVREAADVAAIAERWPRTCTRGVVEERLPFRPRVMRLTECHTVTALRRRRSWSLVIRGRKRRDREHERSPWGFYLPAGWVDEATYDETVRAGRRDL